MTSTEFGLLRRLEMIGWAKQKYGEHWQIRFCEAIDIKTERLNEWMVRGRHAGTAMRIELAARKAGFFSRYDRLFKEFTHHQIIVDNFIEQSGGSYLFGYSDAQKKGVLKSGEILSTPAAERLVAALGFDLPARK